MRRGTMVDAMARWLVLTVAGVVLLALVPPAPPVPAPLLSSPALGSLHVVHVSALVMITLAWAVFAVRLTREGASWRALRPALALGLAWAISVITTFVAVLVGPLTLVTTTFAISVLLQVALSVRVDRARASVAPAPAPQDSPTTPTRAPAATA